MTALLIMDPNAQVWTSVQSFIGASITNVSGSDDEDGVAFVSAASIPGRNTVVPGRLDNFANIDVGIPVGSLLTGGRLHAWIDLNGDGVFGEFDLNNDGDALVLRPEIPARDWKAFVAMVRGAGSGWQ